MSCTVVPALGSANSHLLIASDTNGLDGIVSAHIDKFRIFARRVQKEDQPIGNDK